ncbi:F-box/FBD/LRR-repeat protein At1g13570-like [Bidens hawaiensis]|uniref:F-box/FBD/LRR-repeat protein At1g13570-like n=1 Tax=Bidens hawaiensis TaxID=980011 RepID=UPI00404A3BCE
MDMINKLPPIIIESILCLLPIQEAARTSILSKEWRYHWTKIPKLAFHEDAFQVSSYGDELSTLEETFDGIESQRKGMTKRCKFFYAIYQVLLKHEGPIDEFTLSMLPDKTCVEIDHIISYLSRNKDVKKLKLDVAGYRLPSSFFMFGHLTDLYLGCCELDHRPTFKGSYYITSLFLEDATTTTSTLVHFLSNCSLLKSLTLYTDDIQDIGNSTITNLFECLPVVENLCVWLTAMKCCAQNGVPRVLPSALVHLKYLYINGTDLQYGLSFILLLIRSSPNLEKLKLKVSDQVDCEKHSLTREDHSDIWLPRLNKFEIFNLNSEKLELDFVKFILATSPVLKKAKISLWKDIDDDDEK